MFSPRTGLHEVHSNNACDERRTLPWFKRWRVALVDRPTYSSYDRWRVLLHQLEGGWNLTTNQYTLIDISNMGVILSQAVCPFAAATHLWGILKCILCCLWFHVFEVCGVLHTVCHNATSRLHNTLRHTQDYTTHRVTHTDMLTMYTKHTHMYMYTYGTQAIPHTAPLQCCNSII